VNCTYVNFSDRDITRSISLSTRISIGEGHDVAEIVFGEEGADGSIERPDCFDVFARLIYALPRQAKFEQRMGSCGSMSAGWSG